MVLYFSGTGNSRYVAHMIAAQLGDRVLDTASAIREGHSLELASESPWIFVAPIYAWQLPRIFLDLLKRSRFSGSRKAYFVATCGDDMGDAGACLSAFCREKHLDYMGTLPVIMPNNYIPMFDAPAPEEAAGIIAEAIPAIRSGIARIHRSESFPPLRVTLLDKIKSGPINRGFNLYAAKSTKFTLDRSCTGCGSCAALCPLNNISLDESHRPVWGRNCSQCMACLSWCPAEAIDCGKSKGRTRHRCPPYTAD